MGAHAERFEIEIYPFNTQDMAEEARGPAIRSAWVEPTGEIGASGYACYEGEGVIAEIDARSGTVEAITIDGAEMVDGWSARINAPAA